MVGGNELSGMSSDRGDASGGRGARRGRESLPLGAARLVDMDVGVDQPGHHDAVPASSTVTPDRRRSPQAERR